MKTSSLVLALSISLAPFAAANAADPSTTLSRSSQLSGASVGLVAGTVVFGSLSAIALGGAATVTALEAAGESTNVVLTNATTGAKASLRVASDGLRTSGIAVGSALEISVVATGTTISCAGKLVAFIPNELGRSLLHSAPIARGY